MKYKIGQEIVFTKDFMINTESSGKVKVRKGDKARVVRKINETTGEIVYLTGDAKGKSQNIKIEVDDNLDADAIAKRIMEELKK